MKTKVSIIESAQYFYLLQKDILTIELLLVSVLKCQL